MPILSNETAAKMHISLRAQNLRAYLRGTVQQLRRLQMLYKCFQRPPRCIPDACHSFLFTRQILQNSRLPSIRGSYMASEAFFQNPLSTYPTRPCPVLRRLSGERPSSSPDASQMPSAALQMLPEASQMFPDASRILQMPPDSLLFAR